MNTPDHVLVAGASAAGLATVEALRRKGYAGRVTVLGAEPHLPTTGHRCPSRSCPAAGSPSEPSCDPRPRCPR
ncbi:hypothetical protein ACIBI9_18905 [Nonomuraea sp. NPDC050451]|uniref:hypothetical protein n=1 Tax=Nonomuraea sp. NPDC050451 TaxID=3364364 RepID=UPI0037AA3DE4